MEKKKETMSNWSCVTQLQESEQKIELGRVDSYLTHYNPKKMLYSLSYYKFAAKMIGVGKRVLDVGCGAGMGSWVLAKECGFCKGIDLDEGAIEEAQKNFKNPSIAFETLAVGNLSSSHAWDAVVCLDVMNRLSSEDMPAFLQQLTASLIETGVAIVGVTHVPNEPTTKFLDQLYSFFEFVFLFAANEEVIHTGALSQADYFIALCCKSKTPSI